MIDTQVQYTMTLEQYRQDVLREFGHRRNDIRNMFRRIVPGRFVTVQLHGSVLDPTRFNEDSDIDLLVTARNLSETDVTKLSQVRVMIGGGVADVCIAYY